MWPNPQFLADLVTFTEKIVNWKLHFLCSGISFLKYTVLKKQFQHILWIRRDVLRTYLKQQTVQKTMQYLWRICHNQNDEFHNLTKKVKLEGSEFKNLGTEGIHTFLNWNLHLRVVNLMSGWNLRFVLMLANSVLVFGIVRNFWFSTYVIGV